MDGSWDWNRSNNGDFLGNFILGPLMGSQTTGFILGMSMGVGVGLVLGLSLDSRNINEK